MPFPSSIDAIVDAPPLTAATVIHASQVLGPQRITVGPTWVNFLSDQVGGVNDGVTDNTVAFNSLNNQPSGSRIYFPIGSYALTPGGVTNITKPLQFVGAGRDATFFTTRVGTGNMIPVSGVSSFGVEDITFDGTNVGGTIFGPLGFTNSTFIRVRNCRLRNNTGGSGSNSLTLANVQHAWIEDNEFNNIGGSGVYLNEPGVGNFNEHIWVLNNRFTNTGLNNLAGGNAPFDTLLTRPVIPAIHRHVHIEGNHFSGHPTVGISYGGDFAFIARNRIDNTTGTNTLGEGIALQGAQNKVFFNWIQQRASTAAACILLWVLSGQNEDHNEIAHNTCFMSSSGPGIAVYHAANGLTTNGTYIHDNVVPTGASGIINNAGVGGVTTGSWTNAVIINNKLAGTGTALSWWSATGPPARWDGNMPSWSGAHQIFGPAFTASFTPDLQLGDFVKMQTLTGNLTINVPLNPQTGALMTFFWQQDATGGRAITYNAVFTASANFPLVSTAANAITIDRFIYDGANWRLISRGTG